MKKGVWKATACCLTAAVTLAGNGTLVFADGLETQLAGVGVVIESQQRAKASAGVVKVAPSEYDTTAVAQCEEYVNIRDAASTDGNVLGKLYNNSAATIIGKEGDWYLIQSGSVIGYVYSAYFATGQDAAWLATQVGTEVATINTDGLLIRSDASTDADVLTMVGDADVLEVQEYCGDWVRVTLDDDVEGYVAKEFIDTEVLFDEAESNEEEAARIEAENQAWLDYLAEQEAIREEENRQWQAYLDQQAAEQAAAEQAWLDYINGQEYTDDQQVPSADVSQSYEDAQAAADQATWNANYQQQAMEEAQAAADQAAAEGDEQARQEAQYQADLAYQEYLNQLAIAEQNQAAADQAAADQTYDAGYGTGSDADYTDTNSNVDYTGTGDGTTYEEPSYEEPSYEDPAPTYNTVRDSVVAYALQFVGNPYVYGGTSLTNGTDCSGFTMSVMANFGVSLPRTAAQQAGCGTPVDISAVQPGDLLFYSDGSGIGHVAMYIGGGQIVHASSSTTGIIVSSMSYRTPYCARSFL